MPNGTDQIVYPDELGQDFREPPTFAAGRVPVAAPEAPAVAPPRYDPQATRENIAIRRMLNEYPDLPIAQAEQAVGTAMKFQAIRGYQRDLASGVSPTDALVKWAPIMFSQPKAGNLAGAASLVRAGRPMQIKPMNVGGVAYRFEGNQAIPMTPIPPSSIRPTPQETERRNLLQSDYKDAVRSRDDAYKTALKVAITDEEKQAQNMAYQQINEANQRIEQIRNQLLGGAPAVPAAPVPTAPVSAPAAAAAIPLPRTKAELKKDQTYQTPKGLMRFDGERFHPING